MTQPHPSDERPTTRRRALQLQAPRPRRRRSPRALAASLAAHAVVLWVVGQALEVPRHLGALFQRTAPPAQERLTYVEPAVGGGGAAGGLPVAEPVAPATERPAAARPLPAAPVATPTGIAPAAPSAERAPAGAAAGSGDGTGVGRPGPAAGLQPTYTNSPVWTSPEPVERRMPETVQERIESMVAEDFAVLRDSAALEAAKRRPGDWTFERNGRKYGMDEQFIHLGRLSIPTALLGLVNFTEAQANPIREQQARTFSGMTRESREQGLRRQNDADFRDVVREIRARKDRERAERLAREAALRRQQSGDPP